MSPQHHLQRDHHASAPDIGHQPDDTPNSAWTLPSDPPSDTEPTRPASLFAAGSSTVLPHRPDHHHADDAQSLPHAAFQSSSNSSRPLASLASVANMKRTQRMRTPDAPPPPIAQYSTQIPSAQKATDDPTTPPDSRPSRDSRGREYTTLTTLSRLFAVNDTMPTSRAPSYNQATGPLYMRGNNPLSHLHFMLDKLLTMKATIESIPLPDHLFTRGLLEGRHSDITVIAFGQRYNLHRLILDRAPFFTTALSEPWIESQSREVKLYPEDIDNSITQAAFELAIKRLYGVDISKECDVEAIGLFATGCWLEMQDLIDASIESILRQMTPELLAPLIRLVTSNYYGRSGDRILESAKAMLSRNGWEMPLKFWDGMPGDIIRELVASDGLYVESEWDRWVLAKRLLDRRLRQAAVGAGLMQRGQKPVPKVPNWSSLSAVRFGSVHQQDALALQQSGTDAQSDWLALYSDADIESILILLDEGIHYIHMDYEQLDFIRNARDVFGLPVMPDKVISKALWQQLALRQRVLNVDDTSQELGLCKQPPEPATVNAGTKTAGYSSSKGKQKAATQTSDANQEDEENFDSWDGSGKPRKFWIPSSDCNIVLGNGADPVVTTSNSFQRHATRLSATLQPEDAQWATDFASSPGTMANPNTRTDHGRPISAGGSNAGQPKPIAFTEFPPFRFAAEFPNPRFLKEKKRVYSRTVSYAGSLWNIYIQKVRSAKNVQLGVYLHRAKEREVDDNPHANSVSQQNAGSVDERIGQLEREMLLRSERRDRRRSGRAPPADHTNDDDTSGSGGDPDGTLVSPDARSSLFSPGSLTGRRSDNIPRLSTSRGQSQFQFPINSPLSDGEGPADSPVFPLTDDTPSDYPSDDSEDDDEVPVAYPNPSLSPQRRTRAAVPTLPTYVDARPTIKTYFKIYSPSKGGRMLSIYESAPDRFNFSQSWGWKSSTLMLDEVALTGGAAEPTVPEEGIPGKKGEGKLRFMVVIGNL